jgi:hypothetical protein
VEASVGELDARNVEQLAATFVGREPSRGDAAGSGHPPVLDFKGIS